MALVSLSVPKKATLIVAAGRLVRSACRRRGVRAWRQMRGRVPLRAPRGLLDIEPPLAILVPLLSPTGRHGGRRAIRRRRANGCRGALAIRLLLIVALGRVILNLRRALRRVALALWWVVLLLRWITTLSSPSTVIVIGCRALTMTSTARCGTRRASMGVLLRVRVGHENRVEGSLYQLVACPCHRPLTPSSFSLENPLRGTIHCNGKLSA